MNREFKSKVGWWYHLLIWLMIAACIFSVLGQNIGVTIGVVITTALILHVFFNTNYTITEEGMLILRCGFFPIKKIAIAEIEALEPSVFPGFSYALSLNRIIIWKDDMMWMLISPANRNEFVKQLKKHNPDIELRNNTSLI